MSAVAGHALLGYLQVIDPNLSPEAVLRLELDPGKEEKEILAMTSMLSTGLTYIWECRVAKKQVQLFRMRAEIEAKISILRKTRHVGAAEIMCEMME